MLYTMCESTEATESLAFIDFQTSSRRVSIVIRGLVVIVMVVMSSSSSSWLSGSSLDLVLKLEFNPLHHLVKYTHNAKAKDKAKDKEKDKERGKDSMVLVGTPSIAYSD